MGQGRGQKNELLRYERELKGWSQQKLAELIDTDVNLVSKWERGVSRPSPRYRARLCKLYGKNARELGFIKPPTSQGTREVSLALEATDNRTVSRTNDTLLSPHSGSPDDILNLGVLALVLAQQHYGWAFDELLSRTVRGIKELGTMIPHGEAISRRQALKFLVTIPTAIVGFAYASDTPSLLLAAEEVLPLYVTSVPACWSLYYSGPNEWMEIEKILPTYLSHLTPLAQHTSKYQMAAASLLSQTHQLEAEITLTREDFHASLAHCKQAFLSAQLANDTNLQAASLIREANTLFHRKRSTININQQAAQYIRRVSPLMRGRIYSELSTSCAELGQEQDAYRYLGLAHESTPDRPEDDPSFPYTHSDHYILFFNDMWVYLKLNQATEAWKAIMKASMFVPEVVTPRRMELLRHFVIVAMTLDDLELSKTQFETLLAAASAFGSDLHDSELHNIHQQMLAKWPHERQIKELAELFQE